MTDREQEFTATYHEAGHAVACCVLHRPFEYVTVVPGTASRPDTLGHIRHPQPDRWRFDHFVDVDCMSWDMALVTLAGPVAECRHTEGDEWEWAVADYIHEELPVSGPTHEEEARHILACHSRASRLLYFDGVRGSLLSLLLQTAVALVSEYWELVEAVAQSLVERKTLSAAVHTRAQAGPAVKLAEAWVRWLPAYLSEVRGVEHAAFAPG